MLIENRKGSYKFLRGIDPFSSGAVAMPGYEIVHAVFERPPALWEGFESIEKRLRAEGRPLTALCGMELRIPQPLSVGGFDDFNEPYIDRLRAWDAHVDGLNPVARTNVAPEGKGVAEPSVYAFCYTAPSDLDRPTFVVAGSGETRGPLEEEEGVVARGDLSAAGFQAKVEQTLARMAERLEGMGLSWGDVTQSNVYTVHDIHPLMASVIMPRLEQASRHGVRWHFARPPVVDIEFEMDLRGVRQEIIISGDGR